MKIKRAGAACLTAVMLFTFAGTGNELITAQAAKKGYGTATVKILSTTDLHGQSVRLNYDSGVESEGSLAQIATVIKKERRNIKNGTTITVDGGDTVYGIGSESIMHGTVSGTEYMYEEMKALGYDAITLGNHDFDYGVDYIQKALKSSGMNKKVVLANVTNARTKKNFYPSTKIITKTVKTTTGKKKKIKIGIVGAVTPSLTGHYSWKGIVETHDIVSSVRTGAKSLKKRGCQIVIALIHSGIGAEKPKSRTDNVGYAVTAIPEVDVVCAGHTHMDFPADTVKAEAYYGYSKTDGSGLMHGKPLIEEADHGASLGITKVKIGFTKWGTPFVKSAKAKVRKIKASDAEDQDIKDINDKYDKQYQQIYDQKITDVDGETDNYFGMIEDNPLIQLCNEAKIHYGLKAVKDLEEPYRSAPVISATEYQLAGGEGSSSYIKVDGQISQKNLLNVQSFNQERAKVYYITGAQLKDALEWQVARFYETTGSAVSDNWDSETESLVKSGDIPVLMNRYQKGWEGFFVYDGIEYTINPSVPPRYNVDGQKISDSRRITSLTYNGKDVTDDQIFVLVSRHITSEVDAIHNSDIMNKQVLVQKTDHISTMMEDYIKHQTVNGRLHLNTDNNWNVNFPSGSNYIIRSSSDASEIAKTKIWYQGEIPATNGYSFYKARFDGTLPADTSGPLLVLSPLETETTGESVIVRVEASDSSGVNDVRFLMGVYEADASEWSDKAQTISGSSFNAEQDGVYSVRATDSYGNSTVRYIEIDNIDRTVAAAPRLDDLTNRKKTLTGHASPFATVYLSLSGMEVNAKADAEGRFTFNLPSPGLADDIAELYQVDIQNRKSAVRKIKVGRTGANTPGVVNDIKNTDTTISGTYEDDPLCTILVEYNNTVYVPKGADARYKASSLYKTTNAKNVKFTRKGDSFTMNIPVPMSGQTYKIYGVDWIGRLSTLTQKTVVEAAPNQPKIDTVVAEDAVVSGSIPSPTSQEYTINVTTGDGKTYTGTAGADGHFAVETDGAAAGTKVTVSASDVRDGVTRTSLSKSTTMKKASSLLEKYSGGAEFSAISDEDKVITGSVYDGNATTDARIIVNGKKDRLTLDASGAFSYKLEEPLSYNDTVTLVVRNSDGSLNDIEQTKVEEALPDKPTVTTEKITASTKKIRVVGNRDCTAVLKSGKTKVNANACASNEEGFIYKLTIPEKLRKKGTHLKVYLTNSAGDSDAVSLVVA